MPVMDRSSDRLPRKDATEASVGRVAVPKTDQKNASPRGNASEVPVGRVAVPRTDRDRRVRPVEKSETGLRLLGRCFEIKENRDKPFRPIPIFSHLTPNFPRCGNPI